MRRFSASATRAGRLIPSARSESRRSIIFASMTTPVWALYASDADGGAPAAMADALWAREYAGLPDVRLVRVDDSRHFIMADQAGRFSGLVDQFLTSER